jgi:hypothetical protein
MSQIYKVCLLENNVTTNVFLFAGYNAESMKNNINDMNDPFFDIFTENEKELINNGTINITFINDFIHIDDTIKTH